MLSAIFVRRSLLSAILFFILVSQCDGGNLLVRQNDVTVKVGRTVYLNTDDIVFRKPRRGDEACRVEVVQNDPITQRVGQLEPKVSLMTLYFQRNKVSFCSYLLKTTGLEGRLLYVCPSHFVLFGRLCF